MPSISLALEASIVELERLHQANRAREDRDLAQLIGAVGRLDVGWLATSDEPSMGRGERQPEPRRRPSAPSESVPFVPFPKSYDHGPAVRAKLIAEALERGSW
jgi:hypothetical protein